MKYTWLGFQQKRAVELKLDLNDLAILRWFADFFHTNCQRKIIEDDILWGWVNYQYLIDQIPILYISNKNVIARRLEKLVEIGLLRKKFSKKNGNFTYFSIVEDEFKKLTEYDSNVQNLSDSEVLLKSRTSVSKSTGGFYPKVEQVLLKSRDIYSSTSILEDSTNTKQCTTSLYCDEKNKTDDFLNEDNSDNDDNRQNDLENFEPVPAALLRTPSDRAHHSADNRNYRLSKNPTPPKKKEKKKLVSLPNNFKPSDSHLEYCIKHNLNPDHEFAKFCAHHESTGKKFVKWDRAFTTWLLNAVDFKQKGSNYAPRKKSNAEIHSEACRDALDYLKQSREGRTEIRLAPELMD